MLASGAGTLTVTGISIQEQVIPNADGSSIVFQQRKEVQRQVKILAPQLDFTGVDFCSEEQIKLIKKLQLFPYNVEKLEYRAIKDIKCLIATVQTNFGVDVTDHDNFSSKIETTVSNKWKKF